MKIELHDMSEVYDFAELVADAKAWRAMPRVEAPKGYQPPTVVPLTFAKAFEELATGPSGLSEIEVVDEPETESNPSLPEETAAAPELDADGRRWDARIDSSNKGLNKDGTWRARRNHGLSDEEVAAIKVELTVERIKEVVGEEAWTEAMTPPDEAPAVTETHPLPVDEPKPEPEATEDAELKAAEDAALKATFFELVEQARKPAEDIQKDDIATTLQAAQAFTKAHSPHTFRLLRETITDKTLPGMTPGERRVLLAAMELYKSEGAE